MGQGFTEGFDYVISKIADGTMVIPGDGKNFIQFVHISDLVQALILARKGKSGEVYIVTGGDKDPQRVLCIDSKVPRSRPAKEACVKVAGIVSSRLQIAKV
jgi:nucleoside-diphosphate-sugar epimerase